MCNDHRDIPAPQPERRRAERRNPDAALWPWHVSRALTAIGAVYVAVVLVAIGYLLGSGS